MLAFPGHTSRQSPFLPRLGRSLQLSAGLRPTCPAVAVGAPASRMAGDMGTNTTAKDRILEALQDLPADATIDDAIERLIFLARVDDEMVPSRSSRSSARRGCSPGGRAAERRAAADRGNGSDWASQFNPGVRQTRPRLGPGLVTWVAGGRRRRIGQCRHGHLRSRARGCHCERDSVA